MTPHEYIGGRVPEPLHGDGMGPKSEPEGGTESVLGFPVDGIEKTLSRIKRIISDSSLEL